MQQLSPDLDMHPEIVDFNREFIHLLSGPGAPEREGVFGMPLEWQRGLRHSGRHMDTCIAQLPCLLVEVSSLLDPLAPPISGASNVCNEPGVEEKPAWRSEVRVFTASLLIYMWSAVRRDPDAVRLYLGLHPVSIDALAGMNLTDLRKVAEASPDRLRARFTTHPRFWSDIVRVSHLDSNHTETAAVARLAALPLLVARVASGI